MLLFGCLLAFGAAVAPRLILILAWIFRPYRWDRVWDGNWILPCWGSSALPYTTIMYMLVMEPGRYLMVSIGSGSVWASCWTYHEVEPGRP